MGLFALKARELVWTPSFIISNSERQPSNLSRAFLLSVSATFTQVLLTTSRIAKKLKSICRSRKQQPMFFKSNWNLILTTKPKLPDYALVCWAGGLEIGRASCRERV